MAHHIPTETCETCGRETRMVCECCGAPCCGHCQREGSMCPSCYAKHERDYGAWCAERDAEDIEAMENDPDYYDDSMDGDHESALASAGFGTDEDYGCFGGDEGW